MREVILFNISITGTYRVEAEDSIDAINKTKEWVEENANSLDYTWTQQTAFVEDE